MKNDLREFLDRVPRVKTLVFVCLALTLLLIALKLDGLLSASWIWVFAPVWMPLAIVGVITILVAWAAHGTPGYDGQRRDRDS